MKRRKFVQAAATTAASWIWPSPAVRWRRAMPAGARFARLRPTVLAALRRPSQWAG